MGYGLAQDLDGRHRAGRLEGARRLRPGETHASFIGFKAYRELPYKYKGVPRLFTIKNVDQRYASSKDVIIDRLMQVAPNALASMCVVPSFLST